MRGLLLGLFVAAACGGGSDPAPIFDTPDADPNAPDADPDAPDARPGPGAPDAGGLAALSVCWESCGTAADCGNDTPLTDADNYECSDSVCLYQGCRSTQECVDTFMSADYVCADPSGAGLPGCLLRCVFSSDCASATAAYDADNYDCVDSACVWTGCNTDAECAELDATWVCRDVFGSGLRTCTPTCATAADCVTTTELYDADNYECVDSTCRWTGCNSTAECQSGLMSSDYVCR